MGWYNVSRVVNTTDRRYCYNGDTENETSCRTTGPPEWAPYFDYRKEPSAASYIDGCYSMTLTGNVDGCFVDGCLSIEAPTHDKAVKGALMAAKMAALKALQLKVPGPLICGSGGGLNLEMAASQVQSFGAKHAGWWGNMMHMNTSASQGYMFEAHGHELCYNANISSLAFLTEYAAFLMFAQKWTYHVCGAWCGSDPVWPAAFDLPLGAPVNNATAVPGTGDNVWTRGFTSGTEIFFSKANTTGWVKWGAAPLRFIAEHYPGAL